MMPALAAARTALCTAAVAATIVTFGVLARPLLHSGFPAGHDAPAHITYTYLFNRAIAEGQFPVRWVEGVRAGYSQPLFNFYQPGFYYLVEITHLAVPSLALSLKITVVAAWALGAVFMYLLCSSFGRMPGVLAASLFICSPYILLDVFVRSAYPELAAVALAPGLLWVIQRATDRPRPGYLAAVAGLTALALVCHLPTFLAFSLLVATTIAVGLIDPDRRRQAVIVALACGIGAGMSAFYVMPALGELHLTRISELTSNYFDFHRHFLAPKQWLRYSWAYGASTEGTNDQMSFQIGVAQLVAIAGALAGLVWVLATRRSGASASAAIAWLAVLALSLFLMTAQSVVLWETVPALAYLQFPWRLLMVVTVACGALGAYALSLVPSRSVQAAIVLAAVVGQLALVHHYAKPKAYIPHAQMDIDRSGWKYTRSAYEAAFVEPGYFPARVKTLPPPGVREWQVISGKASVTTDLVTAVRVVLSVDAETDAVVRIASHAFPGWTATVDGRAAVPLTDSDLGFLTVAVPRGRHHVDVSFENTQIRAAGNALSVASAVACVVLALVTARWRA